MKSRFSLLALLAGAALLCLPSGEVHSQLAPGMDFFKQLQDLALKNDEIIKRQEETIKTVDDLLQEAKQARIFSKRG